MKRIDRRDFMRRSAGALAATAMGKASGTEKLSATTVRTLGKSGIQCTLLGMGTGMRGWNGESDLTRKGRKTFLEVVERAYERGLRYFDMADQYGAHDYLKEAMKNGPVERDKVMLLTKTTAREPERIRADLERYRRELDTDYLDVVLLHCMSKPDWPDKMRACMDVMEDAKQKGSIRAQGVSCHSLGALEAAADSDWVDVVLARINPFGVKMDGPPEKVVPLIQRAHDNGKGVVGIKIVGEGQIRDRLAESIKFVLGLGTVDAMAIGFLDASEVDSAIAHIEAAS